MIEYNSLIDAIDKCEKEPLTPSNREKLSQLYIIFDHNFSEPLSKRQTEKQTVIATSGDSDFLKLLNGKSADDVWKIIDELVTTIGIIQPALYHGKVLYRL